MAVKLWPVLSSSDKFPGKASFTISTILGTGTMGTMGTLRSGGYLTSPPFPFLTPILPSGIIPTWPSFTCQETCPHNFASSAIWVDGKFESNGARLRARLSMSHTKRIPRWDQDTPTGMLPTEDHQLMFAFAVHFFSDLLFHFTTTWTWSQGANDSRTSQLQARHLQIKGYLPSRPEEFESLIPLEQYQWLAVHSQVLIQCAHIFGTRRKLEYHQ